MWVNMPCMNAMGFTKWSIMTRRSLSPQVALLIDDQHDPSYMYPPGSWG